MRARGGGPSQSAPCAWACSFVQGLANARCGAAATLAAAGVLVLVTTLAAVHVPSWSVAARITPTAKAHLANSLGVGPVFVVGCGHSGTSLMTRMLGAHSRLWNYPGETGMLEKGSLARARAIGTDLQRQATQAGKPRWVEKTPDHVYRIQDAFDSFTDAHVVIMVRDGRDVVASLLKRGTYSPQAACHRWSSSLTASLPWWDHPRVTVVRYEQLVFEPRATMSCVLAALGEHWEPGVLRYHEHPQKWWVAPKLGSAAASAVAAGATPPRTANLRARGKGESPDRAQNREGSKRRKDVLWGCARVRLPAQVEARAAARGGSELVLRVRHQALRNEQVNQAVHTRSVGMWKDCLSRRLQAMVDRELGALLAAAGYDTSDVGVDTVGPP